MSSKAAWNILNRNLFFVKNAVKRSEAKTSDKLDIHDAASRELLLECREPDIGVLTKATRFMGGGKDRGSAFDYVAQCPDSGPQVLRVSRSNATFSVGGRPIQIHNHDQEIVGTLNKKQLSFGNKFEFSGERGNPSLLLEAKSKLIGDTMEWRVDGKTVAMLYGKVKGPEAAYFKEGEFSYAFSIAQEVPPNDVLRQILVALAIAHHRVEV